METALNINQVNTQKNDEALLRMLDLTVELKIWKWAEILPIEEAFEKITELRNMRRNARS